MKSLISEKSLLVYFEAKKSIQIQCDASKNSIACYLLQIIKLKPVWLASMWLTEIKQLYAIIEKEFLAVKKFHHYMYGYSEVKIYTNYQLLVSIIKKNVEKIGNNRLKRLKLKLLNYNFSLEYLPGKK